LVAKLPTVKFLNETIAEAIPLDRPAPPVFLNKAKSPIGDTARGGALGGIPGNDGEVGGMYKGEAPDPSKSMSAPHSSKGDRETQVSWSITLPREEYSQRSMKKDK
jgi:hypothetical protein